MLDDTDYSSNELENNEIKNRLDFYKKELIDFKDKRNELSPMTIIGQLIDFIDKINFSYRDNGILQTNINYFTDSYYTSHAYGQDIVKKFEMLEKPFNQLIDSIDFHIRSPNQLTYKKLRVATEKNPTKSIFDKLFRKKSPISTNSDEIKTTSMNFVSETVIERLHRLLEKLHEAKKLDTKKVERNPLLLIQAQLIGILESLDRDGRNRYGRFMAELEKFQKFDRNKRLGLTKFDLRNIKQETYLDYTKLVRKTH